MQLVKTQPEFQTYELLEAIVKVSEIQKERLHQHCLGGASEHWIVSFNMGRQCGHTTAIHEYALNHKDENILVVCCNSDMIKYCVDQYNKHENIDYTTINTNTILSMNPNKYDRIFFDVVPVEKARNFVCNRINHFQSVKSIVCVGNI